jgi:hypothetical protein
MVGPVEIVFLIVFFELAWEGGFDYANISKSASQNGALVHRKLALFSMMASVSSPITTFYSQNVLAFDWGFWNMGFWIGWRA